MWIMLCCALMESSPYFINRSGQLIVFDEVTHRISESPKPKELDIQARSPRTKSLTAYQLMEALSEADSDFQKISSS